LTFHGLYGVISQKTELLIDSGCLGKGSDYKVEEVILGEFGTRWSVNGTVDLKKRENASSWTEFSV
jgi:hypothetical protein